MRKSDEKSSLSLLFLDMLAKIPHPYTRGVSYAMIDAEASLEIYNICMNSKQNLGSNSAVIKTRGAMRGYYNPQEEALRVIGN
jgi:hypothetical protein